IQEVIGLLLKITVPELQHHTRWNLAYFSEPGLPRQRCPYSKYGGKLVSIQRKLNIRNRQKTFHFRSEIDLAIFLVIKQRALAEPVPGQCQRLPLAVVNCKRKCTIESLQAAFSPVYPCL